MPRRKKSIKHLYIIDDNKLTFDYVIEVLVNILPDCNEIKAASIATIVDGTGSCLVFSGKAPEIYLICAQLRKHSLNAEIKEDENKN